MEINGKILISFLLVMALSIMVVSAATGTVSLDLPTDASSVTGTFVLNVTNSTFDEMVNCSFTIASSLTANTSVTIGTLDNDTLDNVNTTFDSTSIEDSDDYTITAACRNSSNDQASDTATITVDNTIPGTPTGMSPADANVDTDGSVTFSVTVIGVNTTSCTLNFTGINPGNPGYTMTHSGNTCTKTITSIPENTYNWQTYASDETNISAGSTETTQHVDITTSAGKAAQLIQQKGVTSKGGALLSIPLIGDLNGNMVWIVIIGIAVLVIIVISKRK